LLVVLGLREFVTSGNGLSHAVQNVAEPVSLATAIFVLPFSCG